MEGAALRPLSIGELLDRAVTIAVRAFVPLAIVTAVAVVPEQILTAIVDPTAPHAYADVYHLLTASSTAARNAAMHPTPWSSVLLLYVVGAVFGMVSCSAITAITAAELDGTRVAWSHALAIAVRVLPRQILVGLAFAGIGLAGVIAFMIIASFVFLIASVTGSAAGAIVGLVMLVCFVAGLGLMAWLGMAWMLAEISVVTEAATVNRALGDGWRRAFTRPTAFRSLLAGIAAFGTIGVVSVPVAAVTSLAVAVVPVPALYFAIFGIGQLLLTTLVSVFVVVYAFDVRVRREGIDLQAIAEPAAATSP